MYFCLFVSVFVFENCTEMCMCIQYAYSVFSVCTFALVQTYV